MIRDLTGPQPQAGVIGEIGISREPTADEWRVLDSALAAQEVTGAPIWIHQSTTAPMAQILEHLVKGDRDLSRIVLCHVDYDLRDLAVHRRALATGLRLELDLFGFPAWARRNFVHAPTDTDRIECILELASDGYGSQLLMSQDLCQKLQLRRYGGFGLGHLLAHVREIFDLLGGTPAVWDAITRENPARLLAWRGSWHGSR
jgi:phosphotriesterase-related protein